MKVFTDTRALADAGVPLQFRHPLTNEPMVDGGKPVGVLVRSLQGRVAQEGLRTVLQMSKAWADEPAEVLEDHQKRINAQALPMVAGFFNLSLDGVNVATEADAEAVLDKAMVRYPAEDDPLQGTSFAQQILAFLKDADAKLGNASRA